MLHHNFITTRSALISIRYQLLLFAFILLHQLGSAQGGKDGEPEEEDTSMVDATATPTSGSPTLASITDSDPENTEMSMTTIVLIFILSCFALYMYTQCFYGIFVYRRNQWLNNMPPTTALRAMIVEQLTEKQHKTMIDMFFEENAKFCSKTEKDIHDLKIPQSKETHDDQQRSSPTLQKGDKLTYDEESPGVTVSTAATDISPGLSVSTPTRDHHEDSHSGLQLGTPRLSITPDRSQAKTRRVKLAPRPMSFALQLPKNIKYQRVDNSTDLHHDNEDSRSHNGGDHNNTDDNVTDDKEYNHHDDGVDMPNLSPIRVTHAFDDIDDIESPRPFSANEDNISSGSWESPKPTLTLPSTVTCTPIPPEMSTTPTTPTTPTVQTGLTPFNEDVSDDPYSEENTCSICLDTYDDGDEIVKSKHCSHYFHKECIMEWLHRKNCDISCPCCRNHMISTDELCEVASRVVGKRKVQRVMHNWSILSKRRAELEVMQAEEEAQYEAARNERQNRSTSFAENSA